MHFRVIQLSVSKQHSAYCKLLRTAMISSLGLMIVCYIYCCCCCWQCCHCYFVFVTSKTQLNEISVIEKLLKDLKYEYIM